MHRSTRARVIPSPCFGALRYDVGITKIVKPFNTNNKR
nr:MAG TPA: Herpesvirus glycoprotein H main domain [Caudoviricetes sp.]